MKNLNRLVFSNKTAMLSNRKPDIVRVLNDVKDIYEIKRKIDLPHSKIYEVYHFPAPMTPENLLTGTCILYPGVVGNMYFMTKGHRHVRPRAEIYIGVSGSGILLMQNEATGECKSEKISPNTIIYVPPRWMHRHVNVGEEPLITLFSVAADAGHDYNFVKRTPFKLGVINVDEVPKIVSL
jgi:glucose-6-phosphate isomerase